MNNFSAARRQTLITCSLFQGVSSLHHASSAVRHGCRWLAGSALAPPISGSLRQVRLRGIGTAWWPMMHFTSASGSSVTSDLCLSGWGGGGGSEAVLVRRGCARLRARACSELSRRVSLFGDVLNPDAFMRKTCLSRCITAVAMATAKKKLSF